MLEGAEKKEEEEEEEEEEFENICKMNKVGLEEQAFVAYQHRQQDSFQRLQT